MTAGARSYQLSARATMPPPPEKREQTGSSLNRAAVHFVEQRVEPAVVEVHVGSVARAIRPQTGVAVAGDPGDIRLTFEAFLSWVVLPR